MSAIGQLLTGAEISSQAIIGGGLCLAHTGGVVIGPGVRAGNNLTVYSGVTIGSLRFDSRSGRPSGFPTIGEGATLYTKSSVLGPITLGDRVIVGAHALVMSDGPDAGVAIGVPARWS
jgi:serine O-acetyltransferase